MKVLGIRCWVPGRDSLPKALHVIQGETDLPQADLPLRKAMTIGAACDEQAVFRGHAAEADDRVGSV